MKLRQNDAARSFEGAVSEAWFTGQRIKDVRHEGLSPGGRVALTLFETVDGDPRPHPRLRTDLPPVTDADSAPFWAESPARAPVDVDAWLAAELARAQPRIRAGGEDPPAESPLYWKHSLRVQRTARFFAEAAGLLTAWEAAGQLTDADAAWYSLRRLEATAYSGDIAFDNVDSGTYHSFGHDAPFVHYLEALLESLPKPGTESWSLLDGHQQASVQRQRQQAQRHLDHLMRHKYAYHRILETDIERSLGGWLIDRGTRRILSESPESTASLVPAYQLVRVAPGADHPHAGAWVFRDGAGGLRLQSADGIPGEPVTATEDVLRTVPVDADAITFRRAHDDGGLRPDIRCDWDGNGWVQPSEVEWVSWAGHCDIKAILEALGMALEARPGTNRVTEFRSDNLDETTYDRDLVLEMLASVIELGSVYRRADGSGALMRGIHKFGGARNDSRPDQLQFQGPGPGASFRWPLGGRHEAFVVTGIQTADGTHLDMERAFFRYQASAEGLDFTDNPLFLKVVDGDYNLIDVSGARLTARLECDSFDAKTGYPTKETREVVIDLRENPEDQRFFLGTHLQDAASRMLYEVHLDRAQGHIEAKAYRYVKGARGYERQEDPNKDVTLPMVAPLAVTLSRETKRDDPQLFQALLDLALREGKNICADTDMQGPVWNGVVLNIRAERTNEDRAARVERWRVHISARFGSATLEYLVRRSKRGEPEAYCPVPNESATDRSPDFLWLDFPDVGSKGLQDGEWVVNRTMVERGIVTQEHLLSSQGGFYVHDDHIKNVYELMYCALGGWPYTILHANKRYGFRDEAAWRAVRDELTKRRNALTFQ